MGRVAYRLDDGWLHIHLCPSTDATQQKAAQIPDEVSKSIIDWVDTPHLFLCDEIIVLYPGKSARVTQALTELCLVSTSDFDAVVPAEPGTQPEAEPSWP